MILIMSPACRIKAPEDCATRPPLQNETSVRFLHDPVLYCPGPIQSPYRGDIQIFFDTSGSMIGFKSEKERLDTLTTHVISQLHTVAMNPDTVKYCLFHENKGIFGCRSEPGGPYKPRGNTNLHEALLAASNAELTIIITDAVAASSLTENNEGCARGVDTACVARALHAVLTRPAVDAEFPDWGLIIIPLVILYKGPFYTESKVTLGTFDPEVTLKAVTDDFDIKTTITRPRRLKNGTLVFDYRGPRYLLILIIARHHDLARRAAQAFYERASQFGYTLWTNNDERPSRIPLVETPIEVFPGYLPEMDYKKLTLPDDQPNAWCGTIDVTLNSTGTLPRLEVGCPHDKPGRVPVTLSGRPHNADRVSGCIPLYELPAFSFQIIADKPAMSAELNVFLPSYALPNENYDAIILDTLCPVSTAFTCPDNLLTAHLAAIVDYPATADCFAEPSCPGPVHTVFERFATDSPWLQPHRSFNIHHTLELLYRELYGETYTIRLGRFAMCRIPSPVD